MGNIYKNWTPIDNIPQRLYCEGIHDDYEGFRVLLRENDKTPILRIMFDFVRVYRKLDESDLLRTVASIKIQKKTPLFIVDNSSLVEWFNEESYGIYKDKDIKHFAIYTSNDCIDILSEFEPKVEWLR